jgi:ribosomal 50S subunit-associated protein YjgA (DUF615 family)
MSPRLVIATLAACLVLAGCGGSSDEGSSSAEKTAEPTATATETPTPEATETTSASEQKAMDTICSSRSDIKKEINKIQGLDASLGSVPTAKSSLDAISSDLQTIENARKDLSGDRRQELQSAQKTLESDVNDIQQDLVGSIAGGDLQKELQSAGNRLESSFDKSLASVDCG